MFILAVQLAQRLFRVAEADPRPVLPVGHVGTELVAAVALDDGGSSLLYDEEMLGEWQQDRLVPTNAVLQDPNDLIKACRVLGVGDDLLYLRPVEFAVDELGDRLVVVLLISAASEREVGVQIPEFAIGRGPRRRSSIDPASISLTGG